MSKFLSNFSLLLMLSLAPLHSEEYGGYQRAEAFLAIDAPKEALSDVAPLLAAQPGNQQLLDLKITSLARMGDISLMLKEAKRRDAIDKKLLEEMAWAIIRKASMSHSPFIRQEATLAAFMANDAKGIPLCLLAMQDSSEHARLLAYHLAARCPDDAIKTRALQAIQSDSSPRVRLEAIMTVGSLGIEDAKEKLRQILDDKNACAEEKLACIKAYTEICNFCDEALIKELVKNERSQERALACYLVLLHQDRDLATHITALMHDPSFEVRLLAIQCIGIMGAEAVKSETITPLLAHADVKTRVLANWLSLVKDGPTNELETNFQAFLTHQDRTVRALSASSLAHAGIKGIPLVLASLKSTRDPFVRLNLASALIWQRVQLEEASAAMVRAMQEKARLSEGQFGFFSYIGPSEARHHAGIARLPETEDLLCRLMLYSMISTTDAYDIKEPVRAFLKDRTWGISGQTACFLMQEGLLVLDEIRNLLKDENREIALQAAFLLAVYSQDEEALELLRRAYPNSSRQMKEFILYAMGTIGAPSMLPFLVNVLDEPFESLRVIAARAILLSLYH